MNMNMEEIHYTNKVFKYNKSKFEIETLKEGTIMMVDLRKNWLGFIEIWIHHKTTFSYGKCFV